MKIEHIAYMYGDPPRVAAWYVEHLGFSVVRRMEAAPFTHFIADESGLVLVEIYNNPAAAILDYGTMHPLQLHLAFVSENPQADRDRLIAAGATLESDVVVTPDGDTLVMLRDPWGFAIQLCKRSRSMLQPRARG